MSLVDTIAELVSDIERLSRKVDGIRGPGVVHSPTGISISPPAGGGAIVAGDGEETFTARITGNAQDGSNFRWAYAFVQVEKTSTGYGGWTDVSGGISDTLYNRIEDNNGTSGLMGNGVDTANLSGTYAVQPIPTGTRVLVTMVRVDDNPPEYWVTYANGVDGSCSS